MSIQAPVSFEGSSGAIAQPGVVNVIVPEGLRPGQMMSVQGPNGQVIAQVPEDATSGTTLQVTLRYVIVRDNMQPGQLLLAKGPNGQIQQVQVPVGAMPGSMIQVVFTEMANAGPREVKLSTSPGCDMRQLLELKMQNQHLTPEQEDDLCTTVTHMMRSPSQDTLPQVCYRYLTVPDGVQPGQLLLAEGPNGQIQQVQVPVGAVPGTMLKVAFTDAGPRPGCDMRQLLELKMQGQILTSKQEDDLDSDICAMTVIADEFEASAGPPQTPLSQVREIGDALVMARLENGAEHSDFMVSRTNKMKGRSNLIVTMLLDRGLRLCSDNSVREDWFQPGWVHAFVQDAKKTKRGIMVINALDRTGSFAESAACADELYAAFHAGVPITRCFGAMNEGRYRWVQVTDEVFSDQHAFERTMRERHGGQYTPFYETMTLGSHYDPSLAGKKYTLYEIVPTGRAAHANGADRQWY